MSAGRCVLNYVLDGVAHSVEVKASSTETTIGRSPAHSDVVVASQDVSRKHAVVRHEQGRWSIIDSGAANGTFVNGRRLTKGEPYPLKDGDAIVLGTVLMACAIVDAPAPGTSPPLVTLRPTGAVQFEEDDRGVTEAALPLDDLGTVLGGAGWIVDLFSEVAEGLLASTTLDVTLEHVLTLVFNHVPAHRGSIWLYDAEGRLVHRASRTSKGASGEAPRLSQTIVQRAVADRQAFLYRRDNMTGREAESIVALEIRSAMCVPLVSGDKVVGLLYADTRNLAAPFTNEHLKLVSTLAKLSAVGVEQAYLREDIERERAIRDNLARYSDASVVDRIMASKSGQMIVDEADVSVIFADLSGFTTLSEQLSPSEVTGILNSVFDKLTRAIFHHEGTLDKFIGDEVMAFFGAPLPQADHALRAVRAALLLQERLAEYNAEHPDREPLAIRIAINSGTVVVGDIGSHERRDYTIIGDVVNTAKRIESTATARNQIVIGPATHEAVKDEFDCTPQEPIPLKGKQQVVRTYIVNHKKT